MAAPNFKCPQCERTFTTQQKLNEHAQQAHPRQPVPDDGDSPEARERAKDAGARPDSSTPERGGVEQRRHLY